MADQRVLKIEVRERAVVGVVQCTEFDHANTAKLKEEVTQAAAEHPALPFLLELSKVESMPSVALGALLELAGDFKVGGRRMVLVGLAPAILKIMEMTAIQNLFEIQESVDDALKYRFGV
ncbi:MAG: STAS domain-containing protein [Phycisphaerae bacterium]